MATRVRRRPAAATKFWWFEGESKAELTRQLVATPSGRLEVRLAGDKMTFQVVSAVDAANKVSPNPPINDSHKCPPDCP